MIDETLIHKFRSGELTFSERPDLTNNLELARISMKHDAISTYKIITPELRDDYEICLDLIKEDGAYWNVIPDDYKIITEMKNAYINSVNNPCNAILPDLNNNSLMNFIMNGGYIYGSENMTKELWIESVKYNPFNYDLIPEELFEDKEFIDEVMDYDMNILLKMEPKIAASYLLTKLNNDEHRKSQRDVEYNKDIHYDDLPYKIKIDKRINACLLNMRPSLIQYMVDEIKEDPICKTLFGDYKEDVQSESPKHHHIIDSFPAISCDEITKMEKDLELFTDEMLRIDDRSGPILDFEMYEHLGDFMKQTRG